MWQQRITFVALVFALHAGLAGCARQVGQRPVTAIDAWNYNHARRLQLVEGSTTAQQVREGMGVAPADTFRDGRVWFYMWRVKPHWEGVEANHEDATDKADRIDYTEYLFLEFDDAGVLRRHLLTNNRYERNPLDNSIMGPLDPEQKRLEEQDRKAKRHQKGWPSGGKWW
jgi:outer membrane protein assembly factor BamE (lipoprotein component of BamABCDE complex)